MVQRGMVLKPVDFLVLLSLVDGERHGYGIRQDVEELTDGELRLDAGNLYRCLRRLLAEGLVLRSDAARPDDDDPRRRYYSLTAAGRAAARSETTRLRDVLRLGPARRLLAEAEGKGE